MFARCPPRVRIAAVRLDIRTAIKSVQTSHVPRLMVLLVLLSYLGTFVRMNVLTCKRCGLSCENIDQLLCHETTHEGRRFMCAEVDCQCSYVSEGGLKRHMDRMHNKLYRHRCETCERGFMDRSRYYDHVAAHTGVKRHTCSICEMKFTYKTSLRTHVLHIHPNEDAHIL